MGGLEDALDRVVGQGLGVHVGALEVVADVVACVFEAEGPQGVGVEDAGAQGGQLGLEQDAQQVLGTGEQDGEAVLAVELVGGESPQGVGDAGVDALGVVDDQSAPPR